jgi:hypothetical protein
MQSVCVERNITGNTGRLMTVYRDGHSASGVLEETRPSCLVRTADTSLGTAVVVGLHPPGSHHLVNVAALSDVAPFLSS